MESNANELKIENLIRRKEITITKKGIIRDSE